MGIELEKYILEHSQCESNILQELSRETHLKVLFPRMVSGHLQGLILTMLSSMIKPENILEIGTFTGYSAICLSKGLTLNGKIYTIELNDEIEWIIRKYFKKAGIEKKVELIFGDALEIIPTMNIKFDLVFIDGDKRDYLKYYHAIFAKVKIGGFIFADNVLWNNKVIQPLETNDTYTKGILEFNEFIKNDSRIEKVILPIRDGVFIIKKISA